jgi:hypothetical protein
MNTPQNPLEELKRTIALIYGLLANGSPFWAFVAVKSYKYAAFLTDQKEGRIDLTQFEPYGEIIICGEGKSPPDDVTLKVAEMYQTDPTKFKQNVEEDIKRALPLIDEAMNNNES